MKNRVKNNSHDFYVKHIQIINKIIKLKFHPKIKIYGK